MWIAVNQFIASLLPLVSALVGLALAPLFSEPTASLTVAPHVQAKAEMNKYDDKPYNQSLLTDLITTVNSHLGIAQIQSQLHEYVELGIHGPKPDQYRNQDYEIKSNHFNTPASKKNRDVGGTLGQLPDPHNNQGVGEPITTIVSDKPKHKLPNLLTELMRRSKVMLPFARETKRSVHC